LLSFYPYGHASYQQVGLVGVLGHELVGFAQQVSIDAAQLGFGHETHTYFVGDNNEASIALVHTSSAFVSGLSPPASYKLLTDT